MHSSRFTNTILRNLSEDAIERLSLRQVVLPRGRNLAQVGQRIDHLYFLEAGMGSMTTCFRNGAQVEVSTFGYESVVGVSALMGAKHSLNRIFMQLDGAGYSCPLVAARSEFQFNPSFHDLLLRYVQAQLTLSMQNAACNTTHSYEQRLARWLLICSDRSQLSRMELAQEYVSEMLGSTRSTVSIAANHLKEKGAIGYSRGTIIITDRKLLEEESCECYSVVRSHLNNITEFDTDFIT